MRPPAISVPDSLGKYRLLTRIGTGGMGSVFLARAEGLRGFERLVAIKVVHGEADIAEDASDELLREARIAAQIRHPNVVPVIDVDEAPSGMFLVMEYIEGESLSGLKKAARRSGSAVPRAIAARVIIDSLRGLQAVHDLKDESGKSLGVVHRDVSPQNILVGLDGVSRLTDFGIARISTEGSRTRTGLLKGKMGYIAPEQASGQRVTARCDVWAAGVVLWELYAGRRLFRLDKGVDEVSLLLRVVQEDPPRLSSVAEDVTPELDDVVARAISRNPSDRFETARDFARALEKAEPDTATIDEVADFVSELAGEALRKRRDEAKAKEEGETDDEAPTRVLDPADKPTAVEGASAGAVDTKLTASVSSNRQLLVRVSRRPALLAGVVVGAAALGGLVTFGVSSSTQDSVPPEVAPSARLAATELKPEASSVPPKPSAAPSPATAPEDLPVANHVFEADEPIGELRMGDHVVVVEPPARRAELAGPIEQPVVVVGTDGRKVEATPEPGQSTTRVKFPPKRSWTPPPEPKKKKLAPNPYSQK